MLRVVKITNLKYFKVMFLFIGIHYVISDDKHDVPYWHVKSTWDGWGERGHIRLIRGKGFVCNLGREYIASAFVSLNKTHTDVSDNII